jgi:hypothetical protein
VKKLLIAVFLMVAIGYYVLGNYGQVFFEFDSAVHFLGGMFAGTIGMCCWNFLNRFIKISDKKALKILAVSYAVFGAFLAGALWELAQSYHFISGYGPPSDTALDLIMDTTGGFAVAFVYLKVKIFKINDKY